MWPFKSVCTESRTDIMRVYSITNDTVLYWHHCVLLPYFFVMTICIMRNVFLSRRRMPAVLWFLPRERGIEIACRPSVCPSVCLSVTLVDQDHIGWKSGKLIARTQPNTFALRSPKAIHLLPGEHGEIWGRLEVE